MLIQFDVTNFQSFKNKTVLNLMPSQDKMHLDCIKKINGNELLPVIALYGANASGKSNFHKAMTAAILLVRRSNELQVNQKLRVAPFLLDDESKNERTSFGFVYINNGNKYSYGFSLDQKQVYEEYLYEYKSSKPTLIFSRTNVMDYKFTSKYKSELSDLIKKNTPNKLFLATATAWNSRATKDAYMWFEDMVDTCDSRNMEKMMYSQLEASRNDGDKSLIKFMLSLLQVADISITDLSYEMIEKDVSQLADELPYGVRISSGIDSNGRVVIQERKLITTHKVYVDKKSKEYKLNYSLESSGTKRLLAYAPVIKNALKKGKTIVFDEIDDTLHPAVTRMLIDLFQNPKINKNNSQLIFNTHETGLLDLNLLRRDQIYFVEKKETGVSKLKPLNNFSPRKKENIQKGYLEGRYVEVPNIDINKL